MDIGIYKSKVKEGVVAEMLAYKKEVPECGYRRGHVAKCRRLLFGYLNALDKNSSPTDRLQPHRNRCEGMYLGDYSKQRRGMRSEGSVRGRHGRMAGMVIRSSYKAMKNTLYSLCGV